MINIKTLGIIIMIAGAIGFVVSNESKERFKIYSVKYTMPGKYDAEIDVLCDEEYLCGVWGVDEEFGLQQWASVEYIMALTDQNNNQVYRKQYVATASADKSGMARAQNGADYSFTSDYNGTLRIQILLLEGDEVTLEIYRNLPDKIYYMPALFILLLLAGFVLYLKSRIQKFRKKA